MPQLNEKGHIPRELVFGRGSWTDAARECGVDGAEVDERYALVERLHDLADKVQMAAEVYATDLGCELEMLPWSLREDIADSADDLVARFAEFMLEARKARALIEGSNR